MQLTHREHGIDVHDLPVSLVGKYSTDVVLPSGISVGLHGCREDAHRLLQEHIDRVTQSIPTPLPAEMVLRLAASACERESFADAA